MSPLILLNVILTYHNRHYFTILFITFYEEI
ncbi:hypothetical protein [Staphylococcus phage phiSa2wa-st1930]|uniref:Uncharacterized protein n=3 Tax=Triavirus P240 TaxID=2846265 RepID=A0A2I6PE15_9CAUD|nr:hypothetical protein [Staphylococcus phage phiSa2wa_st72]AUM58163.1 hypothetical protein [Staphylococcus phage phiSa2wa_st93mssa]QDK04412.1 hypothetical protein [Staphylococcus phage Sa2wa_st8]UXQ87655.1 hypothetical protein [Staphylococcus phage phiSa2wa-st923]UXQ87725.1 hypothetical protein [Staphylococcus phage phiSa2wa-st1420]UXQ87752.1 hypothetical protein [Staphylococcus phage phiSa2wa-st1930]UYE96051.1 hypothetical protein [Staphylococcus phage phiSa2wa-st1232]UYL83406.1 hypothetic